MSLALRIPTIAALGSFSLLFACEPAPAGSVAADELCATLVETVCEDNEALLRFLTEKLRAIDGVRETETFVYLRMVKQVYAWGTR